MARYPGAEWLGEHSPKTPMSRYDVFCIHTIVGHPPAHAAHISVRADGHVYQSRDTKYRSAANLEGNHRVLASENEDMGPRFPDWGGDGRFVPPLTEEQVQANAEAFAWAHKTHGIPLQLCPDSKPGSRGLAYHRQGIDGNFGPFRFGGRVAGGEVWTLSPGKVCPGDARIAQLPEILRRAKLIVEGSQEVQMSNVQQLNETIDRMLDDGRKARALIKRVPDSRKVVKRADWRLVLINRALIGLQKLLPER